MRFNLQMDSTAVKMRVSLRRYASSNQTLQDLA